MRTHSILAAAMIAGALGALTTPIRAQQVPDRAVALSAGAMGYDASGTGSASVFALSASQTLPWRWIALEGSFGYTSMEEQYAPTTRLGIAELQAQLQWPARVVRPYIGIGGGVVHYLNNADGRRSTEPAVALGAGLRAALSESWGLRLDGRVRGWDFANATDWAVNTTGEVTLGLMRRF